MGIIWNPNVGDGGGGGGGSGTVTTGSSENGVHAVFDSTNSTASNLAFNGLTAGTNITMTGGGSNTAITISASGGSGSVTGGASENGTHAVFDSANSTSTTLQFNGVTAGTGITVTGGGSNTALTIAAVNAGTVTGGASENGSVAIFDSTNSTAASLKFNGLTAGTNIGITGGGSNTAATIAFSGTLPIASGGTGQGTAANAFNALSPITTLGDIIYGTGTNTGSRLAGNTTSTKKFLTQTGTGTVSAVPGWNTIAVADVPILNQNTTGTSANVTGTVAVANGGTGTTTPGLTAGTNVTITGTWPNNTINATNAGTVTGGASENGTAAVFDATNSTAASLKFNGITAGTNITISGGGANSAIVINSTASGGGAPGIGLQANQSEYLCIFPGSISSNTVNTTQTVGSDATNLSGSVIYMPFYVPSTYTAADIYMKVSTLAASSSITAGIYASNANLQCPTGAASNVVTFATTATGNVITAWTPTFTANTLYWLGIQFSTSTTLAMTALTLAGFFNYGAGINALATGVVAPMLWSQTHTYSAGTLPTAAALTSLSASSITNFPLVGFL